MAVYTMTFAVIFCTFALIGFNFVNLKNHDEGSEIMVQRAALIRSGSKTFLRREYQIVAIVVVILAIVFTLVQERFAGVSFLVGAILVLIAEEIGMRGGTYGNVRTTNAARVTKAISRTLRIATLGGSISGFSVPAFGLLGFVSILLICWHNGALTTGSGFLTPTVACNAMSARLTTYSLGFSVVALFNRIGGGTFTKSADIGNDIVSKGEYGLEEDDPRNVCSIADLIGDCINDLAGNLSDLGESYVATLMSCIVISVQHYSYDEKILFAVCAFPILLATGGLLSSIFSIMLVILKNRKRHDWISLEEVESAISKGITEENLQKAIEDNITRQGKNGIELRVEYSLVVDDPGIELNMTTFISAVITVIIGLIGAKVMFGSGTLPDGFNVGWASPIAAAVLGIISSVVVGLLTGVYTDTKHDYVKDIAKKAPSGASFVVSEGMAVGNHSSFWPTIIIAVSIFFAFLLCGFYGIGIAAVGVLSFVGTTISIDAFGPIADNAGGIAESCGLEEDVRNITDQLDALGNTTAAIGKGNAISAATYSTITMFTAFLGGIAVYDLNTPDSFVRVVCGLLLGMAVVKKFLSILTKNTIAAAWKLHDEAVEQFEVPGVKEGTVPPNYNKAIRMATDNALSYMLKPALLSVVSPIVVGILLGPMAVLGLLMGSTVVAIGEAFFNGNAGGAYDNAKKYIEMGLLEGHGKHSPAHLAAITGDTIGDIMKDVLAVCCDICIKIMATVAVALVTVFFLYHIF